MVIKIRLARFGKRHAPFYNIVVAHARTARNSRPLEVIGTYDPIAKIQLETAPPSTLSATTTQAPSSSTTDTDADLDFDPSTKPKKYKDIRVDIDRAKYWLGVGAQPSEPANRLLAMLGLVEPRWEVARKIAGDKGVLGKVVRRGKGFRWREGMVSAEQETELGDGGEIGDGVVEVSGEEAVGDSFKERQPV